MNLDFVAALLTLGVGAAFRISRAARAAGDYLLNTLLPDREAFTYSVENGNMTVRPTMPGLVGMDSPYPPMGAVEVSTFLENSAKIAGEVPMTEQALRHLQDMMMRLGLSGASSNERLVDEALNFLQAVIIQPHLDVREWLKGQALVYGAIDWTFNKKNLSVDYGYPVGALLTPRTGNDAYAGSTSKFWADVALIRAGLRRYSSVKILAHPDTVAAISGNLVNQLSQTAGDNGTVTFRRFARNEAGAASQGFFSADVRDTVQIIEYGLEGEVLNPADPTATLVLPFLDRGKLLGVGVGRRRGGFVVGQGSASDDPMSGVALGYGHVAPTVEGGGQPGLWTNIYTPEQQPWQLIGRGAQNFLPVIEDEKAVVVATTDLD